MKPKHPPATVRWSFVKVYARPYTRQGKVFCRAPDTGREVNLSDFTFDHIQSKQPSRKP